ncbi:FadR/GntR family transcriptional regulator [Leifsonia sp. Leaf264]|uniref:FadR/GntR family transcriptional regulator n=1 Tax=Leifsonia sp. Leaf264 TaxID=1736314 RepID=UPI0006F2F841|nr:FCD domain-containing protein [Leifsonia sp. Leaf264]KQO96616.1 GntR family transcriptional regulator [Leifsonia sp. Leaf264]
MSTTDVLVGPAAPDDLRAWQSVLAHVEAQLLDGTLSPGDHLPPERTLAAELGVGRSSVREAVRVLEAMGLIRTQTGSGPSAGAIIVATPHGAMSALLRLQVAAQGFRVTDVVKTRLVLEAAVVAEVADAASPALDEPRRLLDAMDSPDLTPQEFLALDAAFHVSLAAASGNDVVTAMMTGLRSSIEGYVQAGLAAIDDWEATAVRLREEHRGIIAAIDTGDALVARSRVHAHITGYYAQTALVTEDRSTPETTAVVAAPSGTGHIALSRRTPEQ